MSFYNTGNPVPSIDPRDLDDNAKHIDEIANSTELTYVDRLGVTRKTMAGVNAEASVAATLPGNLANSSDPNKGAALVGFARKSVSAAILSADQNLTLGDMLSASKISVLEYVSAITDRPNPADPFTWDWAQAIQAAITATTRGVIEIPPGIFTVASGFNMKPAVAVVGSGAEATILRKRAGAAVDGVLKADYISPGNDYIYAKDFEIDGNRDNGATGRNVIFKEVHVPSYLQDMTILNSTGNNIEIKNSSVVGLTRVWSNRPLSGYCLDVDTVRSLHIVGGAYEHARSTTAHIRIRNTGDYFYPQVFLDGIHTEGLLENGIAGIELGGGTLFTSVLGVNINGWQLLGKNPGTPTNNPCIRILDTLLSISMLGLSQTGASGFGEGFPAGTPLPTAAFRNISYWQYNTNPTSGYSMFSGLIGTQNNEQVRNVTERMTASIAAFTVTETTVSIPTQADTNYAVIVTPQNFLGNNVGAYIDEASKTTTSFKIKFQNPTSGAAVQLSTATKFAVRVTRAV